MNRLPAWHANRRLADLRTDGPYTHCAGPIRLARMWVDRIGSDTAPTRGLYLHGGVGSGKTSIAAAIAVELGCQFYEMRDFMARVKEEFNCHVREPITDKVVRAPVLVLDDVGELRSTPFVVETVQTIVKRRYDRGGLLVATSNFGPVEMERYLGDALWSRFVSGMVSVPVVGADLRRGVAA